MIVKELIDELQKMPQDADVQRSASSEWGNIEIEEITFDEELNQVIID